jgi:hypothetical protein
VPGGEVERRGRGEAGRRDGGAGSRRPRGVASHGGGPRLGTAPTGGPHLSAAVRKRGGGRRARWWALWAGICDGPRREGEGSGPRVAGLFCFFCFLFQIPFFKPIFSNHFQIKSFPYFNTNYLTILRLLENLLNNFSNIFFKFKPSIFLIQTFTQIFTIFFTIILRTFHKYFFKTFKTTPQPKLMHFNMLHKHLIDSNY